MTCKGICSRHKAIKKFGGGWYDLGAKRCNTCEIFVYWNGIRCPCCNGVLKLTPTTGKNKQKLKIRLSNNKKTLSNLKNV